MVDNGAPVIFKVEGNVAVLDVGVEESTAVGCKRGIEGLPVGDNVGASLGSNEGVVVGSEDGLEVGAAVGTTVGLTVGMTDGGAVGAGAGAVVETVNGVRLPETEVEPEGMGDGEAKGSPEGDAVGAKVGTTRGTPVGAREATEAVGLTVVNGAVEGEGEGGGTVQAKASDNHIVITK